MPQWAPSLDDSQLRLSSFAELVPEFAHLADTIRVIDVPNHTGGLVLRVLMDSERDTAVAFLTSTDESAGVAHFNNNF